MPNPELVDRVLIMQAVWTECDQYRQYHGKYPRVDDVCADGTIRNWRVKLFSHALARLADDLMRVKLDEKYSERRELYAKTSQALDGCVDLHDESALDSLVNEIKREKNTVRNVFVLAKGDILSNILAVGDPGSAFDLRNNERRDKISGDTIILIEMGFHEAHWWKLGGVAGRQAIDFLSYSKSRSFLIAFADGTVWCMRSDTPPAVLDRFMNIETSGMFDRANELEQWRVK